MTVEAAVEELDFNDEGEMWFTEITIYICAILIWYLLIKILWFFCISQNSPRFKQFDARALKPIKARAEQSRIRRQSETVNTTTASLNDRGQSNNGRIVSLSRTQNNNNNNNENSESISSKDETPEEFQLQICKIHRSLRMCFVTSLICTTINVTAIMLNHTLIITGATSRNCIISRLPVTSNMCQRLALYLFFIFRLHYSFGATQFGIKPIYIWLLIASIAICGGGATAYFFIVIVTAPDPCVSELAADAAGPGVAQDLFFNLLLSILFLTRLGAVVKSQSKFRQTSTRNLESAKLKQAQKNYKYYYTMYKLSCLFVTAFIITISGLILIFISGLAAAASAIDSVASNYLLFLSFQFNDNYFRYIFCGCLKLQSLFLGKEYQKEMELHFITNAKKPAHRQSSQTWQNGDVETTNTSNINGKNNNTMNKIDEEKEENDDNNDDNDGVNKIKVVVTTNENDENEPEVKRINTVDSDVSNDLTNTPIDNDNELTISNDNGITPNTPIDDIETQILSKQDDNDNDDEVP